jgi:molybdenum cofactor cytidylyltransferase
MTNAAAITALVLAAGCGTRFSATRNKLLEDVGGRPMVRRTVEAALASRARCVIVITGHAHANIETALADLPVLFVHNPDYASGMASSLRAGLTQAMDSGGALVLLGDMPRVTATTIDRLIAAFENTSPTCMAVAPVYHGQRGNPVLIARNLFPRLATLSGDEGARRILCSVPVLDLPIEDAAIVNDIDTRHELDALRVQLHARE